MVTEELKKAILGDPVRFFEELNARSDEKLIEEKAEELRLSTGMKT